MELNRQERRAMKKMRNAKPNKVLQEQHQELLNRRAADVLQSSENPFYMEDYDIDVVPLAVYLVSELCDKQSLKKIVELFYSYVSVYDMAKIDINEGERLEPDNFYLAYMSKNREQFLMFLKMCRLSKNVSMQFLITAIFQIAANFLSDLVNAEVNKNVNVAKRNSSTMKFNTADEELRPYIVASFIVIYWGLRVKLVDPKAIKDELMIELNDSLVSFIAPLINNGEQYIKWIKKSQGLAEALVNSEDCEQIEDHYLGIIASTYKFIKSYIVEQYLARSSVIKAIESIDGLKEDLDEQKNKTKELRKQKSEAMKDIKAKDKEIANKCKELSNSERQIEQLKSEVAKLNNEIAENRAIPKVDTEEINRLKAGNKELMSQIKDCKKQKDENDKLKSTVAELENSLGELREHSEYLEDSVGKLNRDIDTKKKTIEILTKKLNIANNKIQALS